MIITCISTSNIKSMKDNSASTKVCDLIGNIIKEKNGEEVKVEVVPLVEYDLSSCIMCGKCGGSGKCLYDNDFNLIYSKLVEADGIFFVVPHYAPIPSKLMMILEKLQQLCFVQYCKDKNSCFKLQKKTVGIIGHGGQQPSEEVLKYYKKALLDTVANSLAGVGMKVIGINEESPNGVVFGIKDMIFTEEKLFPDMIHDWEDVKERIEPLVNKMLLEIEE